ncbi:DUF6161 domain-containing protein [Aliiroseovarius marinus]|uniref:DUF6161 domain-containing protein n=1 Tax=Aliiroseovarius marinus TaxID=2500159 RepID=UPI003D7C5613
MDIVDIVDRESLEVWLKERSREDCAWIASRAAARVFPIWVKYCSENKSGNVATSPLLILRALLTSSVAATSIDDSISAALNAASQGARDAAEKAYDQQSAASDAANTAAYAANESTKTAEAVVFADRAFAGEGMWQQVRQDARILERAGEGLKFPLWHKENPFQEIWERQSKTELSPDTPYEFWRRWYDSLLNPDENPVFPDEMLKNIVQIRDETWLQGAESIASEIERIETKHRGVSNADLLIVRRLKRDISRLEERQAGLITSANGLSRALNTIYEEFQTVGDHQKVIKKDVDEAAARVNDAVSNFTSQYTELESAYQKKFDEALATYKANQALRAPADLWADKKEEHEQRKKLAYWLFLLGLLGVAGLSIGMVYLLSSSIEAFDTLFTPAGCDRTLNPELCNGFSFRGMVVAGCALTLLTLGLWFTRIQMKQFLAERHLALDARERCAFAQSYLSLLAQGDGAHDEAIDQRALVYAALFRPSSDGIVKDDGGVDPSISAALSKLLSGR